MRRKLPVEVDPGREVAEIAMDFTRPVEVLREALHNSIDAGAQEKYKLKAIANPKPIKR